MFSKLSVALVGALAIAAQAGLHHGGQGMAHNHLKRHGIKTIKGGYSNQTSTLTSSSSTLGNSPVETSSLPITSTLGSSSIIPTVPLSTGVSTTSGNSPVQTGDHTLTYTLGSGSSTTVITTTIHETSTQTNVNTVYATLGSDAGATGGSEGGSEPTTTITSTSTLTQYKTIVPVSSGVGNSPIGGPGSGSGASGSKCPVPVTVTVTGSPVTVTVTAGSGPSSSGSGESPETTGSLASSSVPLPVSSSKTKTKCPTASTGFITKPYPSFTNDGQHLKYNDTSGKGRLDDCIVRDRFQFFGSV
ncbi:MAG: hypothetical protein Q9194_006879 [Teloschistes cf. exilis]